MVWCSFGFALSAPRQDTSKELRTQVVAVDHMRARYHSAMSAHATIQQSMGCSPAWKWLVDSPAILEPFQKAKAELDKVVSEQWAQMLDTGMTAKGISKELPARDMIAKMQLMMTSVSGPLSAFESHVSYVKLTHAHRPAA